MQNDPRDIVAVFDEVPEFFEGIATGQPKVPRPVVDHLQRAFHGSAEVQCLWCKAPRGRRPCDHWRNCPPLLPRLALLTLTVAYSRLRFRPRGRGSGSRSWSATSLFHQPLR